MVNDFRHQKILFGAVSIRVERKNTNDGRTSKYSEYRYANKWQDFQWKCQIASGSTRNISGQQLIDQPSYQKNNKFYWYFAQISNLSCDHLAAIIIRKSIT